MWAPLLLSKKGELPGAQGRENEVPTPLYCLGSLSPHPQMPQGGAGGCDVEIFLHPHLSRVPSPLCWSMEMTHFLLTMALQAGTISTHFMDED
jgi:hypothetical protein